MIAHRVMIASAAVVMIACGQPVPDTTSKAHRSAPTVDEGKALIEAGDFQEGAKVFEAIASAEPRNDQAHFYLGVCVERLGDPQKATEEYRTALELNPDLIEAHNNLGLLLLDGGDLDGARASLSLYLEKNPQEADAHYNFGILLSAMDQNTEARARFEEARKLAPGDPLPVLSLGDLARAQGKLEEALALYRQAREVAPSDPICAISEAQVLLSLKKVDAAADVLGQLGSMSESDAATLTTAGILLAKFDRDTDAMALYRDAISRDDSYPRAHILLANALARNGDFAEAASHFERFIALDPGAPEADAARKGLEICRSKIAKP